MATITQAQKISISLSSPLFRFLERYKKQYKVKRSRAIEEGLRLLEKSELDKAYAESAKDDEAEARIWDCTINDGLEDETW